MVPWDMSNLIFVSVFLHSFNKEIEGLPSKIKILTIGIR